MQQTYLVEVRKQDGIETFTGSFMSSVDAIVTAMERYGYLCKISAKVVNERKDDKSGDHDMCCV